MALSKEDMLKIYYYLILTRTFESRLSIMYRQGKILGGIFLSTGQEAIPVVATCALRKDDVIAPAHRDLGAFLVKGMEPKILMAQILGKRTGPSKGKDSYLHAGDPKLGIIAPTSIIASSIPIAAGAALSFKIRKEDRVALCFFGEGASSRGDFHEGLNFSGIHKLPAIFVCENNQYSYSVPVAREMAICCVSNRASGYDMPGIMVDGNDVLAIYEAISEAIERARNGQGSSLVECMTYRIAGHSEHDVSFYQPKEEVEEWKKKDPIRRFNALLQERGYLDEQKDEEIRNKVGEMVEEAIQFANASPFPEGKEALEDVFTDEEVTSHG